MRLFTLLSCLSAVVCSGSGVETYHENLSISRLDDEFVLVKLDVHSETSDVLESTGKLLGSAPVRSFSMTLTQGKWIWSAAHRPSGIYPSGASLTATISKLYAQRAWRQLTGVLSGMTCVSSNRMDRVGVPELALYSQSPRVWRDLPLTWAAPSRRAEFTSKLSVVGALLKKGGASSARNWARKVAERRGVTPFTFANAPYRDANDSPTANDQSLVTRMAVLPFETLCTENLQKALAMLPCGGRMGLASVFASSPLFNSSPWHALELQGAVDAQDGTKTSHVRLMMALRMPRSYVPETATLSQRLAAAAAAVQGDRLGVVGQRTYQACPMVRALGGHSTLQAGNGVALELRGGQDGPVLQVPASGVDLGNDLLVTFKDESANKDATANPNLIHVSRALLAMTSQGVPDRVGSKYLLTISPLAPVDASAPAPRHLAVRCAETFPLYLSPKLATLRVTGHGESPVATPLFNTPKGKGAYSGSTVTGVDAIRATQTSFVGPRGAGSGSELEFAFVLPSRDATVRVELELRKEYVDAGVFGSVPDRGMPSGFVVCTASPLDFIPSQRSEQLPPYVSADAWTSMPDSSFDSSVTMLLVPDMSMLFNAMAVGLIGMTLHFSTVFKILASVIKREDDGTAPASKTDNVLSVWEAKFWRTRAAVVANRCATQGGHIDDELIKKTVKAVTDQ